MSECSLIASVAAEKSDRARTLTLMTTDDAAVDMESMVKVFLVAGRATGPVQGRRRWRERIARDFVRRHR